jgi:serine/threonine protein kinase
MQCPRCLFEGNVTNGRCVNCGYNMMQKTFDAYALTRSTSSPPRPNQFILTRGDMLSSGRYRIMNRINLPRPQQKQGVAWSAIDTLVSHRSVVIREVLVPEHMARVSSKDRVVVEMAQRMAELGQYAGFPTLADYFSEKNSYFLVLLYPEGERLDAVLNRQGGALPEAMVAEYGYQLCGLLSLLADQHPPIVHGSINPQAIIISDDRQQVSLIHLPLFPPEPPPAGVEQGVSGYYAPEQVRGEVGLSSDLYGLAATMHHAVTGYDPHARLAFFHPPARRLNPAVSAHMEAILARQLLLSVSQRYAHPSEMGKELAALIESYPDSWGSETPTPVVDPLRFSAAQLREQQRSTLMLNVGVIATISVLLIIGILFAAMRP